MRLMDGILLCDCCGEQPDVNGLARCHLCGGECCDLCLDGPHRRWVPDDERHAEDDGEKYDDGERYDDDELKGT